MSFLMRDNTGVNGDGENVGTELEGGEGRENNLNTLCEDAILNKITK